MAISKTVDLLVEFGFNGSLLTSQNATIIIAYYICKGGSLTSESKYEIKKYLIHALLNGIYGSAQDQLITSLRNEFRIESKNENGNIEYKTRFTSFSFDDLLKMELPSRKSLYISENELDKFLTYRKGITSFFVLTLLYPNLKYRDVQFHQDHIFPASKFNPGVFARFGMSSEEQQRFYECRDMVPNLQLLEGRANESKNATDFKVWLYEMDQNGRDVFCVTNYIPHEMDLEFEHFLQFFEIRKAKLKEELKKILAVNNEIISVLEGDTDPLIDSFEEENRMLDIVEVV